MSRDRVYDAVVIGGGPGGSACAQWLKMLGFQPCVVEARERLGGLQNENSWLNRWIAAIPPGMTGHEVAQAMHDNVTGLDIPVLTLTTVHHIERRDDGLFRVSANGPDGPTVLLGRTVVLATGVKPKAGDLVRRANLLIGPGNAVASANVRGARVAILGGGDNAFENYGIVLDKGASKVRIFARSVRARVEFLEKVPPEHVLVGDCVVDASAMTVNGERYDHILVLYGWAANLDYLTGIEPAMTPRGFVAVDEECRTSVDGVYAVGELVQRWHPCCVTAMADGVVASKSIQRRLEADMASKLIGRMKRGASMLKALRGGEHKTAT